MYVHNSVIPAFYSFEVISPATQNLSLCRRLQWIFFLIFFPLAEYVPNLVDFHFPCLTMIQFIFCHLLFLFVTCVGIASVRLGGPSIHNKGETMSKRPPLGTTGKLALAGKRNCVRQLLDRKQRERDRPWTQIVLPRIPMSLLQAPVVRVWAPCGRIPLIGTLQWHPSKN